MSANLSYAQTDADNANEIESVVLDPRRWRIGEVSTNLRRRIEELHSSNEIQAWGRTT